MAAETKLTRYHEFSWGLEEDDDGSYYKKEEVDLLILELESEIQNLKDAAEGYNNNMNENLKNDGTA